MVFKGQRQKNTNNKVHMLLHRKQLLMAHALIISQLYSNPAFGDDTEVIYAAQESAPAERSALTGDWGGTRSSLADSGLRIAPRLTLFSQGKTSGNDPSEQKFSGKADIFINADLGKMQVMDGLVLTIHAKYNFGQSTNNITNI
jgi:carbohydrate-selective porin OprB